jgi:hypothetical protein
MAGTKLTPEKITSPIQLMAAWFAMLILLVSVFLTGAANIKTPDWASGFLVIFSSVVTLIVIACVTLMLTVFRPHLQEGKEYAQWLKDKNSYSPGLIDQEKAAPKRARSTSREMTASPATVDRSFHIEVNGHCPGSKDVLSRLRRAGFRPNRYESPVDDHRSFDSLEESACIWVGARVQAAGAIEAIRAAIDVWPHLKYMELSTDGATPPDEEHDAVFFGGATSTARERGLRAWALEEILALSASLTQEQFHAAIRAKYS